MSANSLSSSRLSGSGVRAPFPKVASRYSLSEERQRTQNVVEWNGVEAVTGKPVLARAVRTAALPPGLILRLEQESKVMTSLQHAQLVPLLTVVSENDFLWFISAALSGESLQSFWERGGVLSLLESLELCASLLSGLAEMHRHGVLHTAIQPAVIALRPEEGYAVQLLWPGPWTSYGAEMLSSAELLELARFSSPERSKLLALEVGEASDIYAAGCVLYRALTGQYPHDADDLNQLLWRQTTQPVRSLREQGLDVPRVLDELLQRMLSRDARDRYQSAEAVRYDLQFIAKALRAGDSSPDYIIGAHDFRKSLTRSAFISRQAELSRLEKQLTLLRQGTPQLTMVEGLSGYGKSRLLSEFAVRCTQAGLHVFEGRASQDVSQPFHFLEGVANAFVSACALRPGLASQVFARLSDQIAVLLTALPSLAGVFPAPTSSPSLEGAMGESRTIGVLIEFLSALGTAEHPALVILDDCQWAEDLMYRLLLRWKVLQEQQIHRECFVQIIVSFRSDEVSSTSPLRRIEPEARLEVGPLERWEILRLIESMAGPVPPAAAEVVIRLADGSPFMASALMHGLVESRALVFESHQWTVDPLALEAVRSSSHAAAFLSRRLGMLEAETQQVLQAGALLGSEFPLEMVVHLTGLTAGHVWSAVNEARQRNLIWWSSNDGRCIFVHDKIRESLIARQSEDEKRQFHSRAAEYLTSLTPLQHAELAFHLDAAGREHEALEHALMAATTARQNHALELAEQQFQIAWRGACHASTAIKFRIAEGLGDVLMLRGNYSAAEEQFDRAAQLAEDRQSRAEVCCKRGELFVKRGDMHSALKQFHLGLTTLRRFVPRRLLILMVCLLWEVLVQGIRTVLGPILFERARRPPSKRECVVLRLFSGYSHACWYCQSLNLAMWAHLRGMNLGERRAPSLELAQAYSDHAPAMVLVRWFSRGTKYAERSLAIRKKFGDQWGQGQSLHYYGIVLYAAGRYDECIDACRRAIQILERMGDYWQVHIARYQVAAARYHLGDLAGAVEESRRNYASGLLVGDEQASGIILDIWARAAPGKIPPEILEREVQRHRNDAQGAAQVLLAAAIQADAQGRLADATDILEQARTILETSKVRNPYTLPVSVWLITLWRKRAENDRALNPASREQAMYQAIRAMRFAWLESWRFQNDLPQILREAALLAAMQGRPQKSLQFFQRSLQTAVAVGARYDYALSLTEKARVAKEFGWPDAERDARLASAQLAELTLSDREVSDWDHSPARPSVSLIDRFETLLKSGRGIIAALSRERVCQKVEDAAIRLLRAERAEVVWLNDSDHLLPALEQLLADSCVTGRIQSQIQDLPVAASQSALCAPISVRGQVVAGLMVVHDHQGSLFGPDEERIADFLATLAGAAFENAEGFAELQRLNATLEQKVVDRTASLQERAEQLAVSNQELEHATQELRLMQDQLVASKHLAEDANHAKSRFLAAISHEIRTPMNGVIGMAELALATDLSDRQHTYVATISQSAKALLSMLNDVLDFSKIEAGKLELESRPFHLHQTIVESVRLLSVTAWQKGLTLDCCLASHLPDEVLGDSARLRQVLLNLIGNAIKFTGEGGVTVLGSLDESGQIHLTVKDTGIGIPSDRLNRIFEAFDQGEASVTRRYGGTGLGLAISSQLVTLAGGTIWVESEVGQGSEFHVQLPLLPATSMTPSEDSDLADFQPVLILSNRCGPPQQSERRDAESSVFSSEGAEKPGIIIWGENLLVRDHHAGWCQAWGFETWLAHSETDLKLLLADHSAPCWLLLDFSEVSETTFDGLMHALSAGLIPVERVVALLPSGAEAAAARLHAAGLLHVVMKPIVPRQLLKHFCLSVEEKFNDQQVALPNESADASPLKILVVDDSLINQEVAVGLLELMGHQATAVESGEAALDYLSEHPCDMVFMDVEMPDMNGMATTRFWREKEHPDGPATPIYAMSAHVTDEVRRECFSAGMNGFLSKPVDPAEIRAALEEVQKRRLVSSENLTSRQ